MLLPEWYPQEGILMAWPDQHTDWHNMLAEVRNCYKSIIEAILIESHVFLLCVNKAKTKQQLKIEDGRLIFIEAAYNDTWTRDYGPLAINHSEGIIFLDFGFNGWGEKFNAIDDNRINKKLYKHKILNNLTDHLDFILEGGSIDTDGMGTLLTTSRCLLAKHRNQPLNEASIKDYLKKHLKVSRILWLNNGYLAGDDTDSHVDTLVRFCSENTICYVSIDDPSDEHYDSLKAMENELISLKKSNGKPYQLIKLPMANPIFNDLNQRLPATYANFLIMGSQVLVPTYNSSMDQIAIDRLASAFSSKRIIGIDCRSLIKQNGSLHCITMQIPKTTIATS